MGGAALLVAAAGCADAPTARDRRSASPLTTPPTASELAAIFKCSGCVSDGVVRLNLPESGTEADAAKLWNVTTGERFVAAVRSDRTKTTLTDLRSEEGAAYRAKYGKLEKDLRSEAMALAAKTPLPVRIAVAFDPPYLARGTVGAELAAHVALRTSSLVSAKAGVLAALKAAGHKVVYDAADAPFVDVEADLDTINAISARGEVVGVHRRRPTVPASTNWHAAVRANTALAAGATGDGIPVCSWETGTPSDPQYAHLRVDRTTDVFNTSDPYHPHIYWTSAFIRNDSSATMTPTLNGARVLLGNGDSYGNLLPALSWCLGTKWAPIVNISRGEAKDGDGTVNKWLYDYYTKQSPWPLFVAGAGNDAPNPANVRASGRAYSTLVVGGSDDRGTPQITDDWMYSGSEWKNPVTAHGDFELPHLVAPAVCVEVPDVPSCLDGTSFATPLVSATAAMVIKRDYSSFSSWPEMTRAVILGTSLQTVSTEARFTRLSYGTSGTGGGNDVKQGVGILHAKLAYDLADPANFRLPGSSAARLGRYRKQLDRNADFGTTEASNHSKDQWNMSADVGLDRLRVVTVWDGTGTGTIGGVGSTTLDGDMDLQVIDVTTGSVVCDSNTYDSSWEACDLAVTAGHAYRARLVSYWSSGAQTTYLGVAWVNYSSTSL